VAIVPGSVIRCRPIGMLKMEDESGMDEKIVCVPHDKISPLYKTVHAIEDLPEITRAQIEHFFTRYKDLEPGKWVKVTGWADKAAAEAVILKSIEAAK
jgi:inorganic pyrophosphatase